jgi:hypothetical protein
VVSGETAPVCGARLSWVAPTRRSTLSSRLPCASQGSKPRLALLALLAQVQPAGEEPLRATDA